MFIRKTFKLPYSLSFPRTHRQYLDRSHSISGSKIKIKVKQKKTSVQLTVITVFIFKVVITQIFYRVTVTGS